MSLAAHTHPGALVVTAPRQKRRGHGGTKASTGVGNRSPQPPLTGRDRAKKSQAVVEDRFEPSARRALVVPTAGPKGVSALTLRIEAAALKDKIRDHAATEKIRPIRNTGGLGGWRVKFRSPTTGRWIYRYDEQHIALRERSKHLANRAFAATLPRIRAQVTRDLKKKGSKNQLCALVVAIIDGAYLRVGNERSDDDGVFGATTLRARHLHITDGAAVFDYVGKKRVQQHRLLRDPRCVELLEQLRKTSRGPEARLFKHGRDVIDAADVNRYLEPFGVTAKQFRTYHANRLLRLALRGQADASPRQRRQVLEQAVERVAEQLGHSPAVCRQSYLDPALIERFLDRGRPGLS